MFVAMGVGAYTAGIFHLVTHAFFKACLFLGSGSVIHAMGGEQDMRKMGGLKEHMPTTHWTFLIATLAIAGIFPLSGFVSKDEILWESMTGRHGHPGLWLIGFIVAGLTAFYMFRQVYMVFYGENRSDHHTREHLHESPPVMTYPLVVLALLALVAGALNWPHILGGGAWFERFLSPVFEAHGELAVHAAAEPSEAFEMALMVLSLAMAGVGIAVAYAMYHRRSLSPERFTNLARGAIYRVLYNKYYVDEIYEAVFVRGTLSLSRLGAAFDHYVIDAIVDGAATLTRGISWLNGLFDNYVVDGAVNGVARVTVGVGSRFRRLQTGNLNGYLYVIAVATLIILLARVM